MTTEARILNNIIPEKLTGNNKLTIHSTLAECLGPKRWDVYKTAPIENLQDREYQIFLHDMGIDPKSATIRKLQLDQSNEDDSVTKDSRELVAVEFPYNENVNAIYIINAKWVAENSAVASLRKRIYNMDDIILCGKESGRSFSIRERLGIHASLAIQPYDYMRANAGFFNQNYLYPNLPPYKTLQLYPLKSSQAPHTPLSRLYWNMDRGFEGFVLVHELGHTENVLTEDERSELAESKGLSLHVNRKMEVDAWKWALEALQQLRDNGIDLALNITSQQLENHIELMLRLGASYNSTRSKDENSARSSKTTHYVKSIRALASVIRQDPQLIKTVLGL